MRLTTSSRRRAASASSISASSIGNDTMTPKGDHPVFHFLPGYPDIIAEAASQWAWIEFEVHWMIWRLAEVNPTTGACLTAQIFTFGAKIDALLSLLRERDAPEEFVKKISQFAESARGALDARNRFVHDVWLNDLHNPDTMGRLQVTASKRLKLEVQSFTTDQMQPDLEKITRSRKAASALRKEMEGLRPTLTKIPPEGPHPLFDIR